MSVKREIEWFSNKVIPENGSLIIIKTNIVNIFEDYDEEDDFEVQSKSFPGMVYGDGRGGIVIDVWNGEHTALLKFEYVLKWAYLPNLTR